MKSRWQAWLVGLLGHGLLRAFGLTWRIRFDGPELPPPPDVIVAFRHGEMLPAAYSFRRSHATVVISEHGDGELIAQVIRRFGFGTVRGSTTRGGVRALRRLMRDREHPWAITPDGPRGPRGSVQEGVILLASRSGRPIVPLGFAASRGKRLSSWDRFLIPLPFSRIVCHHGEALRIPPHAGRDELARYARELERRLADASERALQRLQPGE